MAQQKLVGQLSGGERNRVQLAKVLRTGGNVLLLDEPTNDLDVDTLRALEEALLTFPGCAVVISHDRWFLDRIATHVLAFEDEADVRWFEGNFSEYEADRRKRLGASADQPHRLRRAVPAIRPAQGRDVRPHGRFVGSARIVEGLRNPGGDISPMERSAFGTRHLILMHPRQGLISNQRHACGAVERTGLRRSGARQGAEAQRSRQIASLRLLTGCDEVR